MNNYKNEISTEIVARLKLASGDPMYDRAEETQRLIPLMEALEKCVVALDMSASELDGFRVQSTLALSAVHEALNKMGYPRKS